MTKWINSAYIYVAYFSFTKQHWNNHRVQQQQLSLFLGADIYLIKSNFPVQSDRICNFILRHDC